MSMLGSNLLLIIKRKYCIGKFVQRVLQQIFCFNFCSKFFAMIMTVDVTDILQTSKHNFQSQAKHVRPRGKIFVQNYFVLFGLGHLILMSALVLLRYYGSCYRLQHVEKHTKTQKRTRHVKKSEHAKVQRKTCRKKRRKEKEEDRKKEKGPKLHAAW